MREPDVDDVTAHRYFSAVLHLGFAAVTVIDEPTNELVAINLSPESHVTGVVLGWQHLQQRAHGSDDYPRCPEGGGEASSQFGPTPHDGNIGADSFEGGNVPRRPLGHHGVVTEPRGHVVGEIVGLALGRNNGEHHFSIERKAGYDGGHSAGRRRDKSLFGVTVNFVRQSMQQGA
jgi:hypothetical protein